MNESDYCSCESYEDRNLKKKHEDRMRNLVEALDDYELNTKWERTDWSMDELNALYMLRRRVLGRLEVWPGE